MRESIDGVYGHNYTLKAYVIRWKYVWTMPQMQAWSHTLSLSLSVDLGAILLKF